MDAVKPHGRMRSSEHFPTIVETDPDGPTMTYEDIVRKVFDDIASCHGSYSSYIGYHDYIVVPLTENVIVVSFRKPVNYEVNIRRFEA